VTTPHSALHKYNYLQNPLLIIIILLVWHWRISLFWGVEGILANRHAEALTFKIRPS